jgi:purine nucleoside phosphorylase
LAAPSFAATRPGGGGGNSNNGSVRSTSRSNVNQPSANRSSSANNNVNKNTNVNHDVNVNVNNGYNSGYYGGGCCYHNGIGTAAAVAATAVVTAAVVGSMVNTLPPNCTTIMANGITYQQCGSTYFQPQFSGGSTTYVVVNHPY